MAELKQGRWVKVHEPGQADFTEDENVMDIMIGSGRCQAEATYTVRSFKKVAYWLQKYLEAADALQTVSGEILEQINTAAETANRGDDEVKASGAGWDCGIVKMGDGSFKVSLAWTVDEEVTKKAKKKAAPKKRGRKKKEVAANETDA